jgi:hypothetical protein
LGKEACGRHLSEMQLHEKGLQEPQPTTSRTSLFVKT